MNQDRPEESKHHTDGHPARGTPTRTDTRSARRPASSASTAVVVATSVLPARYERDADGFLVEVLPASACPDVLTAEEAVRYLRLDEINITDPERSLNYYRETWGLRAIQLGKKIRFRRIELERLLDRLTDDNPR